MTRQSPRTVGFGVRVTAVLAEAAAPKPPTTGSTKGEVAEGEEKPDGTEGEGASGDGWAKPKPVLEDDQDAEHPTVWSSQEEWPKPKPSPGSIFEDDPDAEYPTVWAAGDCWAKPKPSPGGILEDGPDADHLAVWSSQEDPDGD
ncbi:hypothetical protein T484DRAFT_1842777 [Baffinella frigidus]|nr:hypothetical protein T484DRAFT_1842777 [Cryptophyta sp. CCMP2293]